MTFFKVIGFLVACLYRDANSWGIHGKSFWVMFPSNKKNTTTTLTVAGNEGTMIQLSTNAKEFGITDYIDSTGLCSLTLGEDYHANVTANSSMKGLHISANGSVAVNVLTVGNTFAYSYTAVPEYNILFMNHRVVAYCPDGLTCTSFIAVMGIMSAYVITVSLRTSTFVIYDGETYTDGDTIELYIGHYEIAFIRCRGDLSGTSVAVTFPVHVFAGTYCDDESVVGCDFTIEQFPSTFLWGSDFVLSPLPDTIPSFYRIVTDTEKTEIKTVENAILTTLNAGEFFDLQGNSGHRILSSTAVAVALLILNSVDDVKNPIAMTMLRPVEKLASYVVVAPVGFSLFVQVDDYPYFGHILMQSHQSVCASEPYSLDESKTVYAVRRGDDGLVDVMGNTSGDGYGLTTFSFWGRRGIAYTPLPGRSTDPPKDAVVCIDAASTVLSEASSPVNTGTVDVTSSPTTRTATEGAITVFKSQTGAVSSSAVNTYVTSTGVNTAVASTAVNTAVASTAVNTYVTSTSVNTAVTSTSVNTAVTSTALNTAVTNTAVNTTVASTAVNTAVASTSVNTAVTSTALNTAVTSTALNTAVTNTAVNTAVTSTAVNTYVTSTAVNNSVTSTAENNISYTQTTVHTTTTSQKESESVLETNGNSTNAYMYMSSLSSNDNVTRDQTSRQSTASTEAETSSTLASVHVLEASTATTHQSNSSSTPSYEEESVLFTDSHTDQFSGDSTPRPTTYLQTVESTQSRISRDSLSNSLESSHSGLSTVAALSPTEATQYITASSSEPASLTYVHATSSPGVHVGQPSSGLPASATTPALSSVNQLQTTTPPPTNGMTVVVTISHVSSVDSTDEPSSQDQLQTARAGRATTASLCSCPCWRGRFNADMFKELELVLEGVRKNLTLDKTQLSSTIRKRISAQDSRKSATGVGAIGTGVVGFIFGLVVLADLISLVFHCFRGCTKLVKRQSLH